MSLKVNDSDIFNLIQDEKKYQFNSLRLIASENYVSKDVIEAVGSIMINRYSEGYAGKRYYQGQKYIDQIESLAIKRCKELFKVEHANVQALSGSAANLAAYCSVLSLGDTILSMSLPMGGHLTHGWGVSMTSKLFNFVHYGLDENYNIDYDEVERLADKHKPKLILCGGSAIPRVIDFERFRYIADKVNAILMADMAHIAGLIVGNVHPSPAKYADIITTTTHKTLRGPRGALIMSKKAYANNIDKTVFPGLQGGPHQNNIAGIAVALLEASNNTFKQYAKQVILNAKALANKLIKLGYNILTDGTDTHMLLIDLSSSKYSGKEFAVLCEKYNIIINANSIPFSKNSPMNPSGIRLGVPAVTTLGAVETDMEDIANVINNIMLGEYDNINDKVNTIIHNIKLRGVFHAYY